VGSSSSSSKRRAAVLDTADCQFAGFGEFDDVEGWCGYVPSSASVIGLFLQCSTSDVAVAVFQQLRVGGTIWKGDHNYKFQKCVRKNGQTVYAAVFTIMNVSSTAHVLLPASRILSQATSLTFAEGPATSSCKQLAGRMLLLYWLGCLLLYWLGCQLL
jgi:hypothetical protein